MKQLMALGAVLAVMAAAARLLRPRARVALEQRSDRPGPRLEADIQLGDRAEAD